MSSKGEKQVTKQIESGFQFIEQLKAFVSNLQKGDLGLSEIIQNGFVLYGRTKTGKTASSHILSGNPLKGQKIGGEQVVEATTCRNKKAKIGNQGNSQTMIPNFFLVKNQRFVNGTTYVIDTPGYGDSYGILRILANGYYHYRLYSKVKNMKFILCFDRSQISNDAQPFINTIAQFTSSFNNYLQDKQEIWSCCAFLITKVQSNQNDETILKDLESKLQNLAKTLKTQFMKAEDDAFRDFIKYIIKQKKIFFIKKVRKGETSESRGLLERIDSSIGSWWKRSLVKGKNQVDMTKVSFSLAKQINLSIMDQDASRLQFIELIKFYNEKINEFVNFKKQSANTNAKCWSLTNVLDQLVCDAMGSPDSHNFLDVMDKFVKANYHKFDISYKEERQKRQKQLFAIEQPQSTAPSLSKKTGIKDKNYIVKKFEALSKIQNLKKTISDSHFEERSIQWLQGCQKVLYEIIKQFNRISFKKSKSVEIIYKYGYLVHRIIQEAKIFVLVIEISATPQARKTILQTAGNFIDLLRPLHGAMSIQYTYQSNPIVYANLHSQYVKKFDFDNKIYDKIVINEPLIDFFKRADDESEPVVKKIIKLILKYSDQKLEQIQNKLSIDIEQRDRLTESLTLSTANSVKLYGINASNDEKQKNQIAMLVRNVTNNLGRILQIAQKYELAKKVYQTIKFVDSVCRIYKLQIKSDPKNIELRIRYSQYLADHLRESQAINNLQQSFELVDNMNDLKEVKKQLSELKLKLKSKDTDQANKQCSYQTYMFNFNQQSFEFPEELENELYKISSKSGST